MRRAFVVLLAAFVALCGAQLTPGPEGRSVQGSGSEPTRTGADAFARTLVVEKGSGQYASIQAAIDAIPGDGPLAPSSSNRYLILVYPGVYDGAHTLDKPYTTLMGISQADCAISHTTNGGEYRAVGTGNFPLQIVASDCCVKNLTVSNPQKSAFSPCVIVGAAAPAGDTHAPRTVISGCRIDGGHKDSLWIATSGSTDCVIENCYVRGILDCIATQSNNTLVRDTTVEVLPQGTSAFWGYNVRNFQIVNCRQIGGNMGVICLGANTLSIDDYRIESKLGYFMLLVGAVGERAYATANVGNVYYSSQIDLSLTHIYGTGDITVRSLGKYRELSAEKVVAKEHVSGSLVAGLGTAGPAQAVSKDQAGNDVTIKRGINLRGSGLTVSGALLSLEDAVKWSADTRNNNILEGIVLKLNQSTGDFLRVADNNHSALAGIKRDGTVYGKGLQSVLYCNLADGATVSNAASETFVDLEYALPANYFSQGKLLRMSLAGACAGNLAAPGQMRLRLYAGPAVVAESDDMEIGANQTGSAARLQCLMQCRSAGASGRLHVSDRVYRMHAASGELLPGEVSLNTLVGHLMRASVQFTVADAAVSFTPQQMMIEELN